MGLFVSVLGRLSQSLLLIVFLLFPQWSKADLPPDYQEQLEKLAREPGKIQTDPKVIQEVSEYLMKHRSPEAYIAIGNRIYAEFDRFYLEKGGVIDANSERIFYNLYKAFFSYNGYADINLMTLAAELFSSNEKSLSPKFANLLREGFRAFEKTYYSSEDLLKQIELEEKEKAKEKTQQLIEDKRKEQEERKSPEERAKDRLKEVHKVHQWMSKRVLGQKEVIDSLRDLTLKDVLNGGRRTAPELFYLMGLPGNGKDTIVENYVDALHQKEGAHKKHMYTLQATTSAEIWDLLGSGKGYVGSEELPDFLRFLVEHSGGKYVIGKEQSSKGMREVVEINPDWTEGLRNNKIPPHKAVIFVNEVHNMPKSVKDKVLKMAIERGRFKINNAGSTKNSVGHIDLPVTFIFASNEGIELLEAREANGARVGKPLSYQELRENYLNVKDDKPQLKGAILKTNGLKNSPSQDRDALGVSEEFLNRFPNNRVHILEPLSPEMLQGIVRLELEKEFNRLKKAKGELGQFKIEVSKRLVEYLQEYKYIAAENARPLKNRMKEFIFDSFYAAIRTGKLKVTGKELQLSLDLKEYNNKAASVVFNVTEESGKTYKFHRLIKDSLSLVPKKPISDERIEEIVKMKDKINKNVFGVDHIVDQLVRSILVAESEARAGTERPATLMGFFGKSSTGKTELAKQVASAVTGKVENLNVVDFGKIQSVHDMKVKITGTTDAAGNPIRSEFMKVLDRAQGKPVVFAFDEIANSPKELLKQLYEIFREPVVSDFSDGKPRSMRNVIIILTGNVGEGIYESLPKDLPRQLREKAMHQAFAELMKSESLRHTVLSQNFSDALIARMGQNIFFFSPLQHKPKRELVQLKLKQAFKEIEPKKSERGWSVQFENEKELRKFISMVEKESFTSEHQGASIERYVREALKDTIKTELIVNQVPSGEKVTIRIPEKSEVLQEGEGVTRRKIQLELVSESGIKVPVQISAKDLEKEARKNPVDRILTAYHEIGHELVTRAYMGDRMTSSYLSIIPGVSLVGDRFVHYAGVKRSEIQEETSWTREAVLRHVAILAAGYVAQELVSVGRKTDAGKSDDIMRATNIIMRAVLQFGLSERWGTKAIPDHKMDIATYVEKHLSGEERNKLNVIVEDWLKTGERMARRALLANYSLFVPFSKFLSEKGHLYKSEIEKFYEGKEVIAETDARFAQKTESVEKYEALLTKAYGKNKKAFNKVFQNQEINNESLKKAYGTLRGWGLFSGLKSWKSLSESQRALISSLMAGLVQDQGRDARLYDTSLQPKAIADIDKIVREEKDRAVEKVSVEDFMDRLKKKPTSGKSAGNKCAVLFAAG